MLNFKIRKHKKCQYPLDVIQEFIDIYVDELSLDAFEVDLVLTWTCGKRNDGGGVLFFDYGETKTGRALGKIYIDIWDGFHLTRILRFISHELVHVKQFLTGELETKWDADKEDWVTRERWGYSDVWYTDTDYHRKDHFNKRENRKDYARLFPCEYEAVMRGNRELFTIAARKTNYFARLASGEINGRPQSSSS